MTTRRDFLKTSGFLVVGLSVRAATSRSTRKAPAPVRIRTSTSGSSIRGS